MELADVVRNTEIELLKLIINLLKTGGMRLEEIRVAAKDFLSLLPFQNQQTLIAGLKIFTEKHTQFKALYITMLKMEENKKINDLIAKMHSFVK